MKKPNLIIYESTMEIFEEFGKDEDYDLAFEYMAAIFNYYRTGEEYGGKNREIRLLLKDIYPLINTQQDNYTKKVENVISNEDFTALATSGQFPTQKALAEHITKYYGEYTQSAVSKRLKSLGITLTKTPQSSSSVNTTSEQEIRNEYNSKRTAWGYSAKEAKQHIIDTFRISEKEFRRIIEEE